MVRLKVSTQEFIEARDVRGGSCCVLTNFGVC